jgi:hypothetical protein
MKTIRLIIAVCVILSLTLTTFASEPPLKKTQIDWLISGAGGCLETAGSPVENGTGQFTYRFTSEDGKLSGIVSGKDGIITIGDTAGSGGDEARAFAEIFTRHFANLTRAGHFHASHALSERATEEYPVVIDGETMFITFCYAATENGGMMSAMILGDTVKFVRNLRDEAIEFNPMHNDLPDLPTIDDDPDLETGVEGVAALFAVAVIAAGAVAVGRKRR